METTETMKIYEDACKVLGKTPKPELEDTSDPDEVWADNVMRLAVCIRAKNMVDGKVWVPVYDGSEYHYFPVFDMDDEDDPSGFGFSHTRYGYWYSSTDVGSRLEYRTRELAQQGGEEFKLLYKSFLTQ